MFKKVLGIFFLLLIIFLAIKAVYYLPYFTKLAVGSSKSPFQIGTEYVDQINKIYSVKSFGTQPVYNDYSYSGAGSQVTRSSSPIVGKATLQKIGDKLVLSIENANPPTNLNVWLTNRDYVSDQTVFIDFGPLVRSVSLRQYVIDMKGGDISFDQFNHVLIVDQNNRVYAHIPLK